MRFSFPEPLFSALRAGVLSSCFAKKKVAKEEGDPEGDAGFAGPLRYSAGRAACQNSPAAQTRQAEIPRPACVAQRLPRGPEKRPCPTVRAEKRGSHGQTEKKPKNETHRFSVDALPGPLRGTDQRRNAGGLRRGLSEGEARVPQPPGRTSSGGNLAAGGASLRGRLFFAYFLLAKQKKVRRPSRAEPQAIRSRKLQSPPRKPPPTVNRKKQPKLKSKGWPRTPHRAP